MRLRLALYFLALALIPIGLVTWILGRSAERTYRDRVDARLSLVARAAQAELGSEVGIAAERAASLAGSSSVQEALVRGDRRELARIAADNSRIAIFLHGRLVAGSVAPHSLRRSVSVVVSGEVVGEVVAVVPLDAALVARMARAAPAGVDDRLAVIARDTVVAGPEGWPGTTVRLNGANARIGGREYRVVAAQLVRGASSERLLALAPTSVVSDAVARYWGRLLAAAGATLGAVTLLAYVLSKRVLRSFRELTQIARLADRDELTDLANRRGLHEALGNELRRSQRFGRPFALVVADLDDFKQVNDRHGHQTGDEVLRLFADVLRRSVRNIDVAARVGGEEFAVLLPEADAVRGEEVAERVRAELAEQSLAAPDGGRLRVTASFGVAAYPQARSERELHAVADEALYRAKAAGKNRVETAHPERRDGVEDSRV